MSAIFNIMIAIILILSLPWDSMTTEDRIKIWRLSAMPVPWGRLCHGQLELQQIERCIIVVAWYICRSISLRAAPHDNITSSTHQIATELHSSTSLIPIPQLVSFPAPPLRDLGIYGNLCLVSRRVWLREIKSDLRTKNGKACAIR